MDRAGTALTIQPEVLQRTMALTVSSSSSPRDGGSNGRACPQLSRYKSSPPTSSSNLLDDLAAYAASAVLQRGVHNLKVKY